MGTKRLLMRDAGGNQRMVVSADDSALTTAVGSAAASATAAATSASASATSAVAAAASAVGAAASLSSLTTTAAEARIAESGARQWAAVALRKAMDIAVSVATAVSSAAAAAVSAAAALVSQNAAAASAAAAAVSASVVGDIPGTIATTLHDRMFVPLRRKIIAGTGISGGGNLSTDVTVAVNVGTGASQIVQLDASSKLPAVDGSQLINLPAAPATVDEGKIIQFVEAFS